MSTDSSDVTPDKRYRVFQGVLGEGGFVSYLFAKSAKHAIERFKAEKYPGKVNDALPVNAELLAG